SFRDDELRRLGRLHTAAAARQTVSWARRAGFTNLSLDLMYGLPGQRLAGWLETLRQALDLEPEHLSIYELTVEEGTPFAGRARRGNLNLPAEEEVLAMMEATLTRLAAAGYRRYEISSYARPGRECRHNINYWRNGSYIGLGAGAVSCLDGRRLSGVADVEDYCCRLESGRPVWSDVEQLDREARFRETVIMGLRMTAGVSVAELRRRFDIDLPAYYGPTLAALLDQDLLVHDRERLRLSARGLVLANRVMAELV
ncbi:MAG: coproporphyrinogen III oxidase family protein, partial [Deltaproteobacteria bacterium]|nr:coproporphyrinogen III oxidase family protein [Deltaproteobacteria bacterium]